MPEMVTIDNEGEVKTHCTGDYSYATLCGLDGDDGIQTTLPTPKGAKVDCSQCKALWDICRLYKPAHFKKS